MAGVARMVAQVALERGFQPWRALKRLWVLLMT
jgi:hypothetical protein